MRRLPLSAAVVLTLIVALVPPVALGAGEVSVLLDHESGDYGTGLDGSTSWLRLRYTTGDRVRFFGEVSVLRADVSTILPRTIFGTVPGGHRDDGMTGPHGGGSAMGALAAPEAALVGTATVSETGVGDVRAGIAVRLFGGGVAVHRIDASIDVKIPTADEAKGLGTGAWDTRLALAYEYRFWTATGFAGLGYSFLGDPEGFALDDVADAYVGVETDPGRGGWSMIGWLEARQAVVATTDDAVSIGAGLTRTGARQRWRLLGRVGLTDGAADYGLTLAVSWGVAGKRKDPGQWLR